MLKKFRPRCPINGLVIALPADKLLRDNAEERTEKANVLRDRLRQIHQILGVRFGTFILVTKCDLIGGFAEFFEEIRVDLHQRNQMCGWSYPGKFEESYDPSSFQGSFDEVYLRLRDWSMRYLQRKATDDELGMIVTFPEQFRDLREPLNDYVSTIFQRSQLLEPPFFRGFYFTSAVQEGAPILDIFSKSKAGVKVSERQPKAVDSKAFFIHDFYDKKVFPEHGLVFRSTRHVALNQKMRKVVWIGSTAMVLLMFTFFFVGWAGVRTLINTPKEDCSLAVAAIENVSDGDLPKLQELSGKIDTAKDLQNHYDAYNAPWAGLRARMLFIGANIGVPQEYVGTIHARFVLDCLFRPILKEAEAKIREFDPLAKRAGDPDRKKFLEALAVYAQWYGEVVGASKPTPMEASNVSSRVKQFEKLLALVALNDQERADVSDQFEVALKALAGDSRSFPQEILAKTAKFDDDDATKLLTDAIDKITSAWRPYAILSTDNQSDVVQYWVKFADYVAALRDRYDELLALTRGFEERDEYDASVTRFMVLTDGVGYLGDMSEDIQRAKGSLAEAYFNLWKFLNETDVPDTTTHEIVRLQALYDVFADEWWEPEYKKIYDAVKYGAPNEESDPQQRVYTALKTGREVLRKSFEDSLEILRKQMGLEAGQDPVAYYLSLNLIDVKESAPGKLLARDEKASIRLAKNALGGDQHVKQILVEMRQMLEGSASLMAELEDLAKWPGLLERFSADTPAGRELSRWFEKVGPDPGTQARKVIKDNSGLENYPFWKPFELYYLAAASGKVASRRAR